MKKICVVLDYMYRDAANYKNSPGTLPAVVGELPSAYKTISEYKKAVQDALIDWEWFHPEDIGLPTSFLYGDDSCFGFDYVEDLDHDLHEVVNIFVYDLGEDGELPSRISEMIKTEEVYIEESLSPLDLLEKMRGSKAAHGIAAA